MAHLLDIRETVDEINQLFPSIYKKYHARMSRPVEGGALTLRTLHFLKTLERLGRAGVKDAAAAMGLSSSTVSTLAKREQGRGLVKRHRSTGDERRVELELSQAGRKVARGLPPALEPGLLTFALRKLPSPDRAMLLLGLRKLDAVVISRVERNKRPEA
jgi:DNA-binding MarR family transcriptional regulator